MTEGKLASVEKLDTAVVEKLSETDRLALELAKSRKQTTQASAEKALAQHDTAELAYKYVVLQLFVKYGLTEKDAINEDGTIVKDGNVEGTK